jgi:hypothetical protein
MSAPEGEVTAAVERLAKALAQLEPDESWPTNAELGGSLTGTRDDEFRDGKRDEARELLAELLPVEEMARVDAETSRCSWSIPRDGHPYHEACLYKRERVDGGVSHGACWDMPYARAEALRTAILGGAA